MLSEFSFELQKFPLKIFPAHFLFGTTLSQFQFSKSIFNFQYQFSFYQIQNHFTSQSCQSFFSRSTASIDTFYCRFELFETFSIPLCSRIFDRVPVQKVFFAKSSGGVQGKMKWGIGKMKSTLVK